jgi:hypothetical protein
VSLQAPRFGKALANRPTAVEAPCRRAPSYGGSSRRAVRVGGARGRAAYELALACQGARAPTWSFRVPTWAPSRLF